MSSEQLIHKIETLMRDQTPLKDKLARLEKRDPVPEDKVKETKDLLKRLTVLETIARDRLRQLTKDA